MTKTPTLDRRATWRTVAIAAITLLAGAGIQASARGAEPDSALVTPVALLSSPTSSIGNWVITPGGPALVTGHVGAMDTISIPGSGEQSFLMNNGNGSGTLYTPGMLPQSIITPR
jgi:hypothetical protein